MDINIKNEVLKDFENSLSYIDFSSYNPKSSEFETALYTGLMWLILNNFNSEEATLTVGYEEGNDEISEEIYAAKKYLQKYIDTSDENFKVMATDELKHASYLIKRAYNKPIGNEERTKLKKYESDVSQVTEQIKSS